MDFRPLKEPDLPLLRAWVARPHVAQWWEGAIEFEQALAQYLATLDGEPIGYVQSYQAAACHADGWWLEVSDGGS